MKALTKAALMLGLALSAAAAQAQVYIGASVNGVLAPGVFGRVDIGTLGGTPPLYSAQPVYVQRVPQAAPLYIYAAPYERANWRRYCGRYDACGAPVYFVNVGRDGRWARPIRVANPPRPVYRDRDDHRHWEGRRDDRHWEGRRDDRRWDDRHDHGRRDWDDRRDGRGPNGRGPDGYGPPGHRN